jgi:uncharacterized protein
MARIAGESREFGRQPLFERGELLFGVEAQPGGLGAALDPLPAAARPDNPVDWYPGGPYLLLHAHNPVDWYRGAIARARAEDKPIFLSVGYSTCYWCHVMERESFSDPASPRLMNRGSSTSRSTARSAPTSTRSTCSRPRSSPGRGAGRTRSSSPRLEPFFAGTYFPPRDAHGRPGFATVLSSLPTPGASAASEVEEQARELAERCAATSRRFPPRRALPGASSPSAPSPDCERRFDPTWGGFGEHRSSRRRRTSGCSR